MTDKQKTADEVMNTLIECEWLSPEPLVDGVTGDDFETLISLGFKAGLAHGRAEASELVDAFGCGSHSCYYVKPTGMGVNGPCRCKDNLKIALAAYKEKTGGK